MKLRFEVAASCEISILTNSTNIFLIFAGSLLWQAIQIGSFPILTSQILSGQDVHAALIGIVVAISWIAVFIAGPFVPALIARAGYRKANLVAFVLAFGALAPLTVFSHPAILVASAVAMGVSLIVRWITIDTIVVHCSSASMRGKVIGWHEALMGFGIVLGPLMFVVPSLKWIAAANVALAVVAHAALTVADLPDPAADDGNAPATGNVKAGFQYAMIPLALAAAFVAGFIENSSVALFPLHFEHFGYSLAWSAVLVSAFGFGGTILQPPLGYLADRFGYAFAQVTCAGAIVLSCALLVAFSDTMQAVMVSTFILGAAAGGLNTLAVIEAGKTLSMLQMPSAMTAIAMLYTMGSITGPLAAGSVIGFFAGRGMVVLFALTALLFCISLAVVHRKALRATR
jgi:MFS family permease